jgi:hypothetical protein
MDKLAAYPETAHLPLPSNSDIADDAEIPDSLRFTPESQWPGGR